MEDEAVPTQAQIDQFNSFGVTVVRGLLRPDEVQQPGAEVDEVMQRGYASTPFDGSSRHWLPLLSPDAPVLTGLAEDSRFFGAAEQLMGEDAVLFMADANRYVSTTGWHPDGKTKTRGVKFMLYLEPLDEHSGALRVVPGSQADPVWSSVERFIGTHQPDIADVPAHVCYTQPGDVIAFDFPLWHASVGGSRDRRLCTIEFYRRPSTGDEKAQMKEHLESIIDVTAKAFPRDDFPFFDQRWVDAARSDPQRRVHVDRLDELGLLDIALAAGTPRSR